MVDEFKPKLVGDRPGVSGGFGGGRLKDYEPLIKVLKTQPEKWFLIAEDQVSEGGLRRLLDFDCELSSRKKSERKYVKKDGTDGVTYTLDFYARFVPGSTAKREKAKKAKEKAQTQS